MRTIFVAILTVGAMGTALSAPFAYVLNTNTTIDMVNASANTGSTIGSSTVASTSLAASPTGTLYSANGAGVLWNVTGAPIPVGPTGRTQIADLDYANNGLWGFSNSSKELFFFDLGSSSVTYSQTISVPGSLTFTGVAHQASTGNVYLSGNNGLNSDFLMMVPAFGTSALPIGSMTHGDNFSYISDIDFDASGTLYAMTWFNRWFYTVNTANGATTFVSSGPHRDTTGMALNSVPEPATMATLALGLVALRRGRGRKAK
jgi:hypothetical protein